MSGTYDDTVDFNPGKAKYNLPNVDNSEVYVAKLTSAGSFVWARSMGGSDHDVDSGGLSVDFAGNVYLAGQFRGPTASFGQFTLTNQGGEDIFVTKLDSAGNFVWAVSVGGSNDDGATGIALDNSGNVYVIGFYNNTVDFDPTAGTYYLNDPFDRSSYILKLTQS